MVRVRHERPDPATSLEVKVPMQLALAGGKRVAVSALSLDGLRLTETADISPVRGDLIVPFQGFEVAVPVFFTNSYGETFLWFAKLPARSREMIDLFHRSILRGEMVVGEDVIAKLDTPVDLIPMEETSEEKKIGKAGKSPRWLRSLWSTLFYLILAIAVLMSVGDRIWARLNTVHVDFARVAAPVERHIASVPGFVAELMVEVGDPVDTGDVMIKVSNPETQSAVEKARSTIKQLERQLMRTEEGLEDIAKAVARDRRMLVDKLDEAIARRRYQDFLAGYDLGETLAAMAAIEAFDMNPHGAVPGRRRLEMDLIDRKEELIGELRQMRRELGIRKAVSVSSDIVATVPGVVRAITVQPGEFLVRGMPAVDLEIDRPRFVHGHVHSESAPKLYVGMDAKFSLRTPNGERTYWAKIKGFEEIDFDTPSEHVGVPVRLEAVDMSIAKTRAVLFPGTPADAHADRRLWQRFKARFWSIVTWR